MENKNYSEYIPYKELLSDESLQKVNASLSLVEKDRGELLISDLKLDVHSYIVKQGILRAYINTEDREITFWFPKEGDIVTSTYGYFYKRKGYENFQALESVSLLKIDMEKMRNLYNENLEIANWSRVITEKEGILSEERHLDYILRSPEERYQKLLSTQPSLFQRVMLKEIASYIGVSPVSLSRIRARI